jgi:hypothetical protein
MSFLLNQIADVGSSITWTDKKHKRFLREIPFLKEFSGEINNSWGLYSLYLNANGRAIKEQTDKLIEHGINIDSADRDIKVFNNPFEFNIIFNGSKDSITPIIQRKYKDIKYIKLETLTLPDQYTLTKTALTQDDNYVIIHSYLENVNYSSTYTNENITINSNLVPPTSINITIVSVYIDPTTPTNWIINYIINNDPSIVYEIDQGTTYNSYQLNTNKKISDDRMFYVYIPEIASRNYTTSQENVTFICTATGTNDYTLLNDIHPTFLFAKDSLLQNALRYTVKISDKYGKTYKVDNLDLNANLNSCSCQDTLDYSCRCSYIRNPYYIKFQVSLQFKLGAFEDDIHKDVLNVHPGQG